MEIALLLTLILIAVLCIVAGIAGCFLPVVPGPPLAYVALLILHFGGIHEFSLTTLIIWGLVSAAIVLIDNLIPIVGTKKMGGTKWGIWGSTIGLIAGLFFPPFGIIIGPFLGAMIGELIGGANKSTALKAAFGSFIGFLAGTFAKLVVIVGIIITFTYGLLQGL